MNKLKGAKIIKILSGTIYNNNFLKNIFSFLIIFYSIIKSVFFLLKTKPNFVFGMGGYSSFPVCIAAKLLNFPIVIYENNLHLGKTNRHLLRTACKIFVPYKELEGVPEKYKDKVCEIGNIIRQEILNFGRKSDEINKNDELKILILGGSQPLRYLVET